MPEFDSIVFDLDGTLWDTTPACAVAWNTVLSRNGIPYREIVPEDVQKVTGKPHDVCIQETFSDLSDEHVTRLVQETAVEDNETIARMGGRLYDGVAEGLRHLAGAYKLFIVSNCQEGYIENFLACSKLGEFIQDFESYGNTLQSKAENLRRVIERNSLARPLMVGDTEGDHVAAKANGIPFCLVTYGFGRSAGAEYTAHSFYELINLLTPR